ncbi:MAG: pantoate--beta-alanine ligase [Candidatus Cloacimonetes bacterium 4572_65]|nr:MAG: pantoate--beta-alanine ligase [Candidatus Cloacimonetes bacterium 4572_65]
MLVVDSIQQMKLISREWDTKLSIGFVPTMGALHSGHLDLVKQSKKQNDITVVSIFVNPSQFGENEDFDKYPSTFESDSTHLKALDVDYIFLPNKRSIYPEGYKTWVEVADLTNKLCGKSRPTHFKGVTTIVLKLVNIVQPTNMYMGEKDFQQVVVLERMLTDLNLDTLIKRCAIVRNHDGLALSSRNRYLSQEERVVAPELQKAMQKFRQKFLEGESNLTTLVTSFKETLTNFGFIIDYIEVVDSISLVSKKSLVNGDRLIVAVFLGATRLIDNIEI